MSARPLAIQPADPVINNATAAVQQLAFSLENAVCLFRLIEEALATNVVPNNGEASQIHASLVMAVETLKQYSRVAYAIADTMEAAR